MEKETRSYLLRLWRSAENQPWRATIEQIAAEHAPQHFAAIDDLLNHLHALTASTTSQPASFGNEE